MSIEMSIEANEFRCLTGKIINKEMIMKMIMKIIMKNYMDKELVKRVILLNLYLITKTKGRV